MPFMRYVIARYNKEQREMAYHIYVTDSLFYYGQNKSITVRYADLIDPKQIDNRTAEEIANDIISRINEG